MPRIDCLFPDVYLIQSEVGGRPLQLPLLLGPERALLIDSGSAPDPERVILPALQELGIPFRQLDLLINSHCDLDHQGGNSTLKRALPHLQIFCGEADRAAVESPDVIFATRYDAYGPSHGHRYSADAREWIMRQLGDPQPVDGTFIGGERVTLGAGWTVEILHLPGHSRGHVGVWDRRHNVLFGGDAIHGAVYLDLQGAPALCPTYLDVAPYLATIAHVEALPIDMYVGCHWPVARGRDTIAAFCRESRDFVARAESVLLSATRRAARNGVTLTELCYSVGPLLGAWPQPVNYEMCYALAGHLADLAQRGVIREHNEAAPYRYTMVT